MGSGLQTQRLLPPGLRAEAIAWPVTWGKGGLERVQGVARIRSALEHLVITPLNAYWVDPKYGSLFHQLRTQGMSIDASGQSGGGAGSGLQTVVVSHFMQQVAIYLPAVAVHGVSPRPQADHRLVIHVIWTLATARGQGSSGTMQGPGLGAMAPLNVVV